MEPAHLPDMPVAARTLLAQRCAQVRAGQSAALSPCSSVCKMDGRTGCCVGCLRTMEEIMVWGRADAAARQAIWQRIEARLQGLPV